MGSPTREGKLWAVEAARGIAALLVVCNHASSFLGDPKLYSALPFAGFFGWMHAGVDFFFVLSGFIITYAHGDDVGTRECLGRYAWRRVARIYFPYWSMMAFLIPLYFVSPSQTAYEQDPLVIFASLLLIPQEMPPIYPPAWSLRFEIIFYAVFGVLIVRPRLGVALISGILFGTIAVKTSMWTGAMHPPHWFLDFFFNIYSFQFLGGALAAILLRRARIPMPLIWALVGAVLFIGSGVLEIYSPILGNQDLRKITYGAGAVLMLIGLVDADRSGSISVPRGLAALGTASYSIYLTHVITLMFLSKAAQLSHAASVMPGEIMFLAFAIGATACGVLFSWMIEQPLLRWARTEPLHRLADRIWPKSRATP